MIFRQIFEMRKKKRDLGIIEENWCLRNFYI